jgi:hypothetical protein
MPNYIFSKEVNLLQLLRDRRTALNLDGHSDASVRVPSDPPAPPPPTMMSAHRRSLKRRAKMVRNRIALLVHGVSCMVFPKKGMGAAEALAKGFVRLPSVSNFFRE